MHFIYNVYRKNIIYTARHSPPPFRGAGQVIGSGGGGGRQEWLSQRSVVLPKVLYTAKSPSMVHIPLRSYVLLNDARYVKISRGVLKGKLFLR